MDFGETGYTEEGFQQYCDWWGVYVLQTNDEEPASQVYADYKDRWSIETYHKHIKNDADFNALKVKDYYVQKGFEAH